MTSARFAEITSRYPQLRIGVVGDFCLDRYLEIDPARAEISIETGLPVHNVTRVRSQPGAAGTIVNNLVALGVGQIVVVGFCGEDGEGWELVRALRALRGVTLDHFLETPERATFTYTKPMLAGRELSRLDIKNWSPTPAGLSARIAAQVRELAEKVDALVVMDQVSLDETGVVTPAVLAALGEVAARFPTLPILADSRRGLGKFPAVTFKMNAAELAELTGASSEDAATSASALARERGRPVIVTLAERGLLGALPDGTTVSLPALPVRGEIDVVGAGDSVTANAVAALAAGASMEEALAIANAAASIVIHQLGTTGTASVAEIGRMLTPGKSG
ncbi:MAG: PfkB family carbohydrate kinase [Chthoniobacteraceae bacterium]